MVINRTRILLAFAVFVVIFSAATLAFWEFMRDAVFVPVYYLVWVVGLLVGSVPQGAYLAVLVILSLVIGGKTVEGLRTRRETHRTIRSRPDAGTRYRHWSNLCEYANDNPFFSNWFAVEARRLVLAILAHEHSINSVEAEEWVLNGTLEVPAALRAMIGNKRMPSRRLPDRFADLRSRLRRLLGRPDSGPGMDPEQLIAEVIGFVEQHLEITHVGKPFES
jgi:hypothetical protein